jgi:hypothetical protein
MDELERVLGRERLIDSGQLEDEDPREVRSLLVTTTTCIAAALTTMTLAAVAAGSSGPDPKTLVLQRSDLPAGYSRDSMSGYYSNAQAARDNGTPTLSYALKAMGRITGYQAWYDKPGAGPTGVNGITSAASVYRSAGGARTSFEHSGEGTPVPADFTTQGGDPAHSRRLPSPRIGQQSLMVLYPASGAVSGECVLVWRSGRFLAAITTFYGGRPSALAQATTIAYAKKQENRMVKAG